MLDLIQPHQPSWTAEFEVLKAVLFDHLAGWDLDIQLVGSTGIPGLYAKPILDVDIIVRDRSRIDGITQCLEALGYISRGEQGIADRFAFRPSAPSVPQSANKREWLPHHLYVCVAGSVALNNHLLFRDALLRYPELVTRYSRLKLSLVNQPGMTREEYTRRKTDFILSVLASLGLDSDTLKGIRMVNE